MSALINAAWVREMAQAVEPDEEVVRQVVRHMRPKTYRQDDHAAQEVAWALYDVGVQVRDEWGRTP
jgi:hypothetical protein